MHINAETRQIPFYVGQHLWHFIGEFASRSFPEHRVHAVADSNVARIYGSEIHDVIASMPHPGNLFTFPAGEAYKNRAEKERLEDRLLEASAGRDTLLLAVGGGVTGDLAGFVAATLHRGIPLLHIPTSLIAQTDSSIGGKVGVNHPAGKNLLGNFYQPHAVFCDVNLLNTLPAQAFIDGLAEVVKYGFMLDPELAALLEENVEAILRRKSDVVQEIVEKCIALKIQVVVQDEKEMGYRSILNFGHTLGHAIELSSDYRVGHGFAVAAGMRFAARLSRALCGLPSSTLERLDQLLGRYGLNRVDYTTFDRNRLWIAVCGDKKSKLNLPRFTLLRDIAQPELLHPVSKQDFENAFQAT